MRRHRTRCDISASKPACLSDLREIHLLSSSLRRVKVVQLIPGVIRCINRHVSRFVVIATYYYPNHYFLKYFCNCLTLSMFSQPRFDRVLQRLTHAHSDVGFRLCRATPASAPHKCAHRDRVKSCNCQLSSCASHPLASVCAVTHCCDWQQS